jgi:hypothetical protein
MSILDLFCAVEAFWQRFEPRWERELRASGQRPRRRANRLHPAEILTIRILFQQSGYRPSRGSIWSPFKCSCARSFLS